jgi:hypothetical protein
VIDWTVSLGNILATISILVAVVTGYLKARDRQMAQHVENVGRLAALETRVQILYDEWQGRKFK